MLKTRKYSMYSYTFDKNCKIIQKGNNTVKITKRLDDYILVRVSDKIPKVDIRVEENRIKELVNIVEKEFREEVRNLKLKFLNECEEKYPELKTLIKDTGYSTDLYGVYGSVFARNVQNAEQSSYTLRRTVHERIVLQIELSGRDLTLDEIDTIIFEEIEKASNPSPDTASAVSTINNIQGE